MTEINVRVLGEDEWTVYRDVRLRSLSESPEAFVATAQEEKSFSDEVWRDRMNRSRRLLAEREGEALGVTSLGILNEEDRVAELFGLWVSPDHRGTGVARKLLEAAASQARQDDMAHLVYWVGTDNGRAVAFASSFGFRPTDSRRPMELRGPEGDDDAEEMAMVLPLGSASGVPTSL